MSFVFYNYTFSQGNLHFEYVIWDSTVVLTFLIPVITMRMFSEEKKNGTDQLLVTSPKSIITIVFGKFFAATFVTIITCLLMFAYYGILSKFGHVNIVEPFSSNARLSYYYQWHLYHLVCLHRQSLSTK